MGYPSPATNKQQEYILEQFNGTTYQPNQMDVQHGHLWDVVAFKGGDKFYQPMFFCNPAGKTYAETNVPNAKKLDAPEAFCIQRFIFTFNRDALDEDVYAIAESQAWSFWIGRKMYQRALLIHMNTRNNTARAPFRICDYCQTVYVNSVTCIGCGASQFQLMNDLGENGLPAGSQFLMDLSVNLIIDNQASFYVQFEGVPLTLKKDLQLWCHFEGLHARGVQ